MSLPCTGSCPHQHLDNPEDGGAIDEAHDMHCSLHRCSWNARDAQTMMPWSTAKYRSDTFSRPMLAETVRHGIAVKIVHVHVLYCTVDDYKSVCNRLRL